MNLSKEAKRLNVAEETLVWQQVRSVFVDKLTPPSSDLIDTVIRRLGEIRRMRDLAPQGKALPGATDDVLVRSFENLTG